MISQPLERIHRSNLIGIGVLPLQFTGEEMRESLALTGKESFDITGIAGGLAPRQDVACTITYEDGSTREITLLCRIDTADEISYYENGGILHYVLRRLAKNG